MGAGGHTRDVPDVLVAVVGAGIVGLLTALELLERGIEPIVLEAATVGAGASGGLGRRGVRANGRHPWELPLMARAYELWPRLPDRIGASTGYVRTGQLQLSERVDDLAVFAAQADRQRRAGVPSEVLDGSGVRKLEPHVANTVVGGVWCPLDGTIDQSATCHAIASALRARGITIAEHATVRKLTIERGGVQIVADGVGAVRAVRAIVAANAAAGALASLVGWGIETFEVFPQALLIEPPIPGQVRHLIGHANRRVILKSVPDGQVMVTGGWLGRRHPTTGRGVIVNEQVRANLAEAFALYPRLRGSRLLAAVADRPEAATRDMLPIIDRNPTGAVAVATGWSGHGFAIAPAVAEALGEWMQTGRWAENLGRFTAHRFLDQAR